jgi:hypothetical protein
MEWHLYVKYFTFYDSVHLLFDIPEVVTKAGLTVFTLKLNVLSKPIDKRKMNVVGLVSVQLTWTFVLSADIYIVHRTERIWNLTS